MKKLYITLIGFSMSFSAILFSADESEVEEVVVVGSQIKGAKITGALPVSVVTGIDIEATGAIDGDDLLEHIAEQGQNYFTEAEDASGGVNASRGDVEDLRDMEIDLCRWLGVPLDDFIATTGNS